MMKRVVCSMAALLLFATVVLGKPPSPSGSKVESESGWTWNEDLMEQNQSVRAEKLSQQARDLYRKRDFKHILPVLHALSQIDPTAHTFGFTARVFLDMKDYKRAIDDSSAAIKLKPKKVRFYITRAQAYDQSHQYAKALADYDTSLKLRDDPNILRERAAIYRKLKKENSANALTSK